MKLTLVYTFYILNFLTFAPSAKCQNIHLVGNIGKTDINDIITLISNVNSTKKPKSISIFCGVSDVPFQILKKKSFSTDLIKLQSKLSNLKCGIKGNEISEHKARINSFYDDKKALLTFNRNGDYTPPIDFNDLNKLIETVNDRANRKAKYVYLMVFTKSKPKINITSPLDNGITKSLEIKGTAESSDLTIKQINVRANNGKWQIASGKTIWSINIPLNELESNLIEAIAIDNENDTSELASISGIEYQGTKINPNTIVYFHPTEEREVVHKCLYDNTYNYHFEISLEDPNIDLDYLYVVVENLSGGEIKNVPLKELELKSSGSKTLGSKQYCFYLSYAFFLLSNQCTEGKFYYYLTYNKDPKNIVKTKKILIYCTSFDADDTGKTYCNCE